MESAAKLVNVTRQNDTFTDNMAVTNSTSLNSVVDLFFIAGASRKMSVVDITHMLEMSWIEDAPLTLKCIFWAGDVRQGAGERRFFRIALEWLNTRYKSTFDKNYSLVPEFNRWDSLFQFQEKQVLDYVYKALTEEKNGLCAKWMPRKTQYNNFASAFRSEFKLSPKAYRKMIVDLSKTVEQQMCKNQWDKISYKGVPSLAMNKYREAFTRNDTARFQMFIDRVNAGEEKINAGAIFPYDIYIKADKYEKDFNEGAVIAQWNALPNYLENSTEKILPICDVSGSMEGLPLEISVSLGIYISERNQSIFKDAFVTFSEHPTIEYLKGTLIQRMRQLERADWDMNTNLNAVFNLLLSKAAENNLSQDDMPTTLLIISDMEFDDCGELNNYQKIVNDYNGAGYKVPRIVFWNVNGKKGNVPVSSKTKEVALVSGASPAILKAILSGEDFTPVAMMKKVLNNERYKNVIV